MSFIRWTHPPKPQPASPAAGRQSMRSLNVAGEIFGQDHAQGIVLLPRSAIFEADLRVLGGAGSKGTARCSHLKFKPPQAVLSFKAGMSNKIVPYETTPLEVPYRSQTRKWAESEDVLELEDAINSSCTDSLSFITVRPVRHEKVVSMYSCGPLENV
jgi:hypothetical protein